MSINQEILLQRENEFLMIKIKEELDAWRKNNYESSKHTVISIVISSLALIFGVFLFITEKSNFGQEFKNILSTSVIGAGGSLTLIGSLASLKNLFKKVNENAEEFKITMETFKGLYQNADTKQESPIIEVLVGLEEYYKDQKKIYKFLEELNSHMQDMLICRSITVTITSLIFLMLAIISIFYLFINCDDYIFVIIDILLISFSSLFLYNSICVMICIQLIIPNVTEGMFSKRREKEKMRKEEKEKEEKIKEEISENSTEFKVEEGLEKDNLENEKPKFEEYKSK
ncbi:3334_t:CDS:1, partial [Dentiscutata heterogama]